MTTRPRILLCDHRGDGLSERAAPLAERYELVSSGTLRQSLRAVAEAAPELVVIEPLSGSGAVELRALDRVRGAAAPIPLLVVASPAEAEAIVRVHRSLPGTAWDVIGRDASAEELELRIERLLAQSRLLREMGELRHRASHDDRTDLLRPGAFQARLVEHFSAAQRHHLDMALVLLDLDRFGAINKLHDHTVGDALIARVGEVIRGALRAEDVAGRLGGDEFAVLLPYTRKIAAAQVVNRLRDRIVRVAVPGADGGPETIRVSASIGFETFDGRDVDSVETLRRHAEMALREAKRLGGDRGVYFRSLNEATAG